MMLRALRALDAWWRAPAPAARLAVMRVLVGLFAAFYLVVRGPHLWSFGSVDPLHFAPIGVTRLLSSPLPGLAWYALLVSTGGLALCFVAGWRHRITGPLFAGALLFVLTYESSFQQVLHTTNLLAFYALVLGVTPAADAVSLDARSGRTASGEETRYGWPLKLMALLCAVSYVVAGVAKLRRMGLGYASGEVLRNHVAYDNLRKLELGSFHSPLGAWLLPYEGLWAVLGAATLALELGAPLAMLGPRWGRVWVAATWCFHLGVLLTMMIFFGFQLLGVAFAPFFHLERLLEWRPVRALRRRFAPA